MASICSRAALVLLASATMTGHARGNELELVKIRHRDLPGWTADRHAEAIPPFLASCRAIANVPGSRRIGASPNSGRARHWRRICKAAARLPAGDDHAARTFFEREFFAYRARSQHATTGKLTGYYVQSLRGAWTRGGPYQTPILARPNDLVSVPLARFVSDGGGRRIWGRIDSASGSLEPYPTRGDIRRGALGANERVLLWVDDPVDAVFAEIEGSGRVTMGDGTTVWIAFDGKNGRRFRGVGGILRKMGELARGEASVEGIRQWFAANPERINEVVDQNPSKVFFKVSSRIGAVGSQDVILTPQRSIAVDRALIALSTPIWVDTRVPTTKSTFSRWRRLLIAQDTGGAIIGPMRGDIYWGAGRSATAIGSRMSGTGKLWLLLPRAIRVR